ncbi:MAG TPA: peptidylprolyl isomerase [Acidimicrobiales bacterium]|nr:peptidylprolyl isomerase [Acidimicrobiales bacterium]
MKELRLQQQRQRRTHVIFGGGIAGALVLIGVIVLIAVLSSGPSKKAATPTTTVSSTTTTTGVTPVSVPLLQASAKVGCPKPNGPNAHYTKFLRPPPANCINPNDQYTAELETDAGTIKIKLLPKVNRVTVNNFVFLARYHFFDGTAFHRVIPGFVDQGGDPTGTGEGGPGYSFNGGAPKSAKVYTAGALAMANHGGNPATDSSQFFIVVGNGGLGLKPEYSYFGQVTSGMSVVDKINHDGSASGTPTKVHKVLKVVIVQKP